MNAWLVRVLGGAACTLGALSLGAGMAHADAQKGPLDGLENTVKVVTKHLSPGTSAKSKKHTPRAPPRPRSRSTSVASASTGRRPHRAPP